MATATFSATFKQTTDAEFRAWVSAVKTAWLAAGWTQTADTGQIDTATVLTPSSTSQSRGYIVAQLNDGVSPAVYVKLEFGSGSATTTPNLWFTLGLATNGSGTVSGGSARYQISLSAETVSRTSYVSYSTTDSRFAMYLNDAGTTPVLIVVERSRASTGAVASVGVTFHSNRFTSGATASAFVPYTGTVTEGTAVPVVSGVIGTGTAGSDIYLAPAWLASPHGALLSLLGSWNADVGHLANVSTTHYSATRNFMALGSNAFGVNNNTNGRVLMLYE